MIHQFLGLFDEVIFLKFGYHFFGCHWIGLDINNFFHLEFDFSNQFGLLFLILLLVSGGLLLSLNLVVFLNKLILRRMPLLETVSDIVKGLNHICQAFYLVLLSLLKNIIVSLISHMLNDRSWLVVKFRKLKPFVSIKNMSWNYYNINLCQSFSNSALYNIMNQKLE